MPDQGSWLTRAKQWARNLRRDVVSLWIAAGDSRTPVAAKLVAGTVAAYALSPIDLIPDFIPVLGYLDDLLIVPLGIALAIRMIPADLMAEFRHKASTLTDRPRSQIGLVAILLIWFLAAAVIWRLVGVPI